MAICRLIAKLSSLLTHIGYSTADLRKILNDSELTIQEHCDTIRHQIDIAREIALEKIHKASNALLTEIDIYEQECLSGWLAAKESNAATVEDVSKRVSAFVAEKQQLCQRSTEVASDDTLALQQQLHEANKLAQELNDRRRELNSTIFSDKLVSFNASSTPSIDDAPPLLGELTFASPVKLPFKELFIASSDLKPVEFRAKDYDFLLPFDQGQHIVLFTHILDILEEDGSIWERVQMSSFTRLGRPTGIRSVYKDVKPGNVAQCGPSRTFVVCRYENSHHLSVYNTNVNCLRSAPCKNFSTICSNSKFVFGLWETKNERPADSDDIHEQEPHSRQTIQVHDLNTLSEAFALGVHEKYRIKRIMVDEHHLVAMSQLLESSDEWLMSIFDFQDKSEVKENANDNMAHFFLHEKHVHFGKLNMSLPVFLHCEWLIVPDENESKLVWFDKKGTRSETSTYTDLDHVRDIYSSGASLFFVLENKRLLLKQ